MTLSMGTARWYEKLESRWGARQNPVAPPAPDLSPIQTHAARDVAASRADVWAAYTTHGCDDEAGWCQHIVGAPTSGVGARHVHLGEEAPPYGLRTVVYVEVVAQQEGHWITLQAHAGAWDHEETWQFTDTGDGRTTVTITGRHRRPHLPERSDVLRSTLHQVALTALDGLADRVEGRA
ncbi:SRPBCC family protein [Cellulomonas sp. PhB150]|uniref:SRPBCC family protein n=1 Tax=Cellulomonas sp. PhB150 TaxID=2485188 RepID=UPI000FA885D2|nr:SRPBCC family protein [Cellulomonas sp. PhB150]ROS23747.1 hypothetical protein EDF34_2807 [Cellulomonas sp. PhB150]